MAKALSAAARSALAATDWGRVDAMNDADIAAQIAGNSDAAPDMAPRAKASPRFVRAATTSCIRIGAIA